MELTGKAAKQVLEVVKRYSEEELEVNTLSVYRALYGAVYDRRWYVEGFYVSRETVRVVVWDSVERQEYEVLREKGGPWRVYYHLG